MAKWVVTFESDADNTKIEEYVEADGARIEASGELVFYNTETGNPAGHPVLYIQGYSYWKSFQRLSTSPENSHQSA